MNTATKAFGLSLAFHSLMALFALLMLNAFHTPSPSLALPLKHITLVSLSQPSEEASPVSMPTPHTKTAKALSQTAPQTAPLTPRKVIPASNPIETAQTPPPSAYHPVVPTIEASPSPVSSAAPAQSAVKAQPKADVSAEKQSFFAHLRTKIQQNLRYPSAARRRGMEGEVNVRFVLDNTGAIRAVTVQNGESIFHEAAKLAVASASGVKVPDVLSDSFPSEIQLTLEFRLN